MLFGDEGDWGDCVDILGEVYWLLLWVVCIVVFDLVVEELWICFVSDLYCVGGRDGESVVV